MTPTLENLRQTARSLFQAAIDAADPARAIDQHLSKDPLAANGRLYLLAIGKAAIPMMRAARTHIVPGTECIALAVTNPENAAEIPGVELHVAAHPVPDENGAEAARRIIELMRDTQPEDHVVALISGGGSALLPAPVEGVSLADKAEVNRLLLAGGLDIVQMNLVRQQLSQLKGGGLLRHAAPAPVTAYILSDVVGDDLRAIASGPTASAIGTREDAVHLLKTSKIWDVLPASVTRFLESEPPLPKETPAATNHLICSNRISLEAMQALAETRFDTRIVDDRLEGDVRDVAPRLVEIARGACEGPQALIFGGETTVTLTGAGKGGRNQDLALRFSHLATDLPGEWVFLSGGTDGRDGPTDAAGGLVDPGTVSRLAEEDMNAAEFLQNNDSYTALAASGDLLMTGGTGTNVADVQVFLRL